MAKYVIVDRVVGTEPYVTMALERDIKDIHEFIIVEDDDLDCCDRVVSRKADTEEELKEELEELYDRRAQEQAYGY